MLCRLAFLQPAENNRLQVLSAHLGARWTLISQMAQLKSHVSAGDLAQAVVGLLTGMLLRSRCL